jgi:hypothetical protein
MSRQDSHAYFEEAMKIVGSLDEGVFPEQVRTLSCYCTNSYLIISCPYPLLSSIGAAMADGFCLE